MPKENGVNNVETDLYNKRRRSLVSHVQHVKQNCEKLGEALIEHNEESLGHKLIANGHCHDQSKFHGVEWLYLHDDVKTSHPELFRAAMIQHIKSLNTC